MLAVAEGEGLPHFAVDAARLRDAATYTAAVIRQNYPTLKIPHHARWRHFAAGGVDRWGALRSTLGGMDAAEIARLRVELCVVSVLLDAGAGSGWRYRDGAAEFSRSEGLGIASLDAFRAGLFSTDGSPKADAAGLARIDAASLGRAFQVTHANPLTGLDGRASLLRRLGTALLARPDLFPGGRIGGLYDALAECREVAAAHIVSVLLDGLGRHLALPHRDRRPAARRRLAPLRSAR